MSTRSFHAASEEEMIETGRTIAALLPPGCVVLLTGRLGAGKTTLAKGIVAALSDASPDEVSSPTFTLIHEHGRVYHIDLYRLDSDREVETLGLDDLIARRDAVLLVEWGERFRSMLSANAIEITITDAADDAREITVKFE